MSDDERERLERLRAKQLADRDPGGALKVEWKGERARKQGSLFQEIFGVLPRHVQGGLIGLGIGIVLLLVIQFLVINVWGLPAEWGLCGLAAMALSIIMGIIIARGTDLDAR